MPKRKTPGKRTVLENLTIIVFVIFTLVLAQGCNLAAGEIDSQTGGTPNSLENMRDSSLIGTPTTILESPFTVYFTDPASPTAEEHRGGPDERLAAAIDQAVQSVDMAMYNLSLVSITDALLRAQKRGVNVRVVMETDALDGEQPQRLADAGIPMVSDQREELMHNKFIVIDGVDVWTGSLNMTTSGTYSDYNNLIQIHSDKMSADYSIEFEEMFKDRAFGNNSPSNTLYPQFSVGGNQVEVYFSPEDGVAQHIIDLIQNAHERIDFLAYSFTSDGIGQAMLDRAAAGVTVRGVFDESQLSSGTGSEYQRLKDAGLDIRLDGIEGLLHNKVIIVDEEVVVTGSYNFTASAENRNDENCLIIHDPLLAEQYVAEVEKEIGTSK
jgi:phosphatidylserine/phosphatidylglycerophosphate/cardiolipin synthase-like enzyme